LILLAQAIALVAAENKRLGPSVCFVEKVDNDFIEE
jgi:hypothetical protein